MEADGLLTRRRDPANRRVHVVELTAAGDAAFLSVCGPSRRSSTRSCGPGSPTPRLDALRGLLARLRVNAVDRAPQL